MRLQTLYLEDGQAKWLDEQKNKSETVRNLIDAAMTAQARNIEKTIPQAEAELSDRAQKSKKWATLSLEERRAIKEMIKQAYPTTEPTSVEFFTLCYEEMETRDNNEQVEKLLHAKPIIKPEN